MSFVVVASIKFSAELFSFPKKWQNIFQPKSQQHVNMNCVTINIIIAIRNNSMNLGLLNTHTHDKNKITEKHD